MKALGPTFGREAPIVKKFVEEADGTALKVALDRDGTVALGEYTLGAAQIVFHESLPEGVFGAPMDGGTVYADVALDDGSRRGLGSGWSGGPGDAGRSTSRSRT
jgi:isoleucyl-tRNA synthetase